MTPAEFPVEQAPPASHVCVIYDPADGRVVHVHEFIGTGFDPDECGRTALATVRSLHDPAPSNATAPWEALRILHAPRGFQLRPGAIRVDLAKNEIVITELSLS